MTNAEAAQWMAWALHEIARFAGPHRAACVAAGAVPALRALAAQTAIAGNAQAADNVAEALAAIVG